MGLYAANKGTNLGANVLKIERTKLVRRINDYRLGELTNFRNQLDNLILSQLENTINDFKVASKLLKEGYGLNNKEMLYIINN